jgi:hypothetical protein
LMVCIATARRAMLIAPTMSACDWKPHDTQANRP